MKLPLYAILIAPKERDRRMILSGEKTATIRADHRDYIEGGKLMLCCHVRPWCVMTDLVSVRHRKLSEVTKKEWKAAGHISADELLESLKDFYPGITWESEVTVLTWKNVDGQIMDDYSREVLPFERPKAPIGPRRR